MSQAVNLIDTSVQIGLNVFIVLQGAGGKRRIVLQQTEGKGGGGGGGSHGHGVAGNLQ